MFHDIIEFGKVRLTLEKAIKIRNRCPVWIGIVFVEGSVDNVDYLCYLRNVSRNSHWQFLMEE